MICHRSKLPLRDRSPGWITSNTALNGALKILIAASSICGSSCVDRHEVEYPDREELEL